jgi:hypothetical protein
MCCHLVAIHQCAHDSNEEWAHTHIHIYNHVHTHIQTCTYHIHVYKHVHVCAVTWLLSIKALTLVIRNGYTLQKSVQVSLTIHTLALRCKYFVSHICCKYWACHICIHTAILIIFDARYQLSTVFSTSLLLENR